MMAAINGRGKRAHDGPRRENADQDRSASLVYTDHRLKRRLMAGGGLTEQTSQ